MAHPSHNLIDRIQHYNQGRIPGQLALKYKTMAADPFSFLRGTCHLFYEDLAHQVLPMEDFTTVFQAVPWVWSCGDLHWQNYGSFKGDDRLVYFDVNDFDEAVLAPCTWDLARMLTSIFVGTPLLGVAQADAIALGQVFLQTYTAELRSGKASHIHRETATGLVADLLEGLRQRDRADFLRDRTTQRGYALKLISNKTEPATPAAQEKVREMIETWAATQPDPDFFKIHDITQRLAGNSSLGLERYLVLVEGKGMPKRGYLLDLKLSRPSCLQPYTPAPQPEWATEADRIAAIQSRFQDSPPALLHACRYGSAEGLGWVARCAGLPPQSPNLSEGEQSFVLRELQPTQDRVDFRSSQGKVKRLAKVIQTMAQVTAWGQLRSSGRQGSAIADTLTAFADQSSQWQAPLLTYAQRYAEQVQADYQTFAANA